MALSHELSLKTRERSFLNISIDTVSLASSNAYIAAPSLKFNPMLGMVTVSSAPPIGAGVPSSLLLAINTAIAPASCAFFTLTVKLQSPRSIIAILPAKSAPFTGVSQPFLIGSTASSIRTKSPERS